MAGGWVTRMVESSKSKHDIALRAAEPWLRQGYTIESVDESGVTLRRPDTIRSLAAGTVALLFRRPRGRIALTVDDDGRVETTYL
jgi:hypothetical protein